MIAGTCLCGAVTFEVSAPFQPMAHCHCSMCRKAHGALHSTSLFAATENFHWRSGEQDIVHYRSSPGLERPFCRHCGSAVPSVAGSMVVIPAGALLGDPGVKPRAHIFVASKSPMYEFTDSLKQFDEYPPGYGSPVQEKQADAQDDAAAGSCLCGEVAFAFTEQPTKITNCHCTRCQRSRGTAHATNTFVHQENLQWLRGEDRKATYKVPDAAAFTTTWCTTCGSLLPSLFAPIKRYLIPLGSLDRPLPTKARLHIHVATRAPWFDITDSLPQFAEMPPRDQIKELMF